jgi:transposase
MIHIIMSFAHATPPTNPAALRAFAATLLRDYAALESKYADLKIGNDVLLSEVHHKTLWIEKLKTELAELKRNRYGRSSEKMESRIDQLEIMLEEIEIGEVADRLEQERLKKQKMPSAEPMPIRKRRTSQERKSLPEHLPRERIEHEAACVCPACGGTNLTLIGTDERSVLDYVPAYFRVIVHARPKMGCRDCETITQPPTPSLPIERGLPSATLLAHVLTAKYCDHLPLYRQSEIYAREGVEINRATMAEWIGMMATLVDPLAEAIREHVGQGVAIHADDTPLPVLEPGRGRTRVGRLWTMVRDERPWGSSVPPAAFYRYSPDRKAEHAKALLEDCSGFLHADAYAGFNQLYELHPKTGKPQFLEVACWAHARRKIYDVYAATASPTAEELLRQIGELFAIEAAIRGRSPVERLKVRAEQSVPLLAMMKIAFEVALAGVSQQGKFAKALRYALTLWPALTRYTTDGRCDICNNAAERAIRPLTLGRKNWLFAGSDNGGNNAAVIFTLTQTAKLNSLDVEAYLRHVINVIPDHPIMRIDELLPWNVKL